MSFFKKLNTLVQSQINDLVDFGKDEPSSRARRKFLSRHDVSNDLQNDVKGLRGRIDDALAYEGELQSKIDDLYTQISDWDSKADVAVSENRDSDARFALGRMQQAQRELEMAESALREHRMIAQELISQVNNLEAILDQAQREAQSELNDTPTGATKVPVEVDDDDDEESASIISNISEKLDQSRQALGQLVNSHTAPDLPKDAPVVDEKPQPPKPPINQRKVEDDLAARRSRLSGPPKKQD